MGIEKTPGAIDKYFVLEVQNLTLFAAIFNILLGKVKRNSD